MNQDRIALRLRINGEDRAALAGPGDTLLDILRGAMGLTGAKRGCDQGVCGACTVLADGKPIRACLAIGANSTDLAITTVEGLAGDGPLTPLQQAFVDGAALQCGFCTPGMIVALTPLLASNARPSRNQIRDAISGTRIAGLGVRVRPSGGRSWIFLRKTGGGTRRIFLGQAELKTVEEVRRECHALAAELGSEDKPDEIRHAVPSFRDFVAGTWKEAHCDRYKPSTQRGVRSILAGQLLPAFGSKPLDRISPTQVRRWFDIYSRTAPGGANRALDLVRQIMNVAVACSHIDTNPARGVKRNRRAALTRFLSREEIARLHRVLDRQTRKSSRQQADVIRLLLLTGCRKGEILRLRWSAVQDDILVLADSKTGPRTVPLNTQARRILERQPRGPSSFVFPSPRDLARPRGPNLPLWYPVRREAGIEDVRLHDLRHTHASHAVMNGVPVPVVSRLLGHSNVSMTLRYAHLGDREIEAAAERVGQSIGAIMGI